MSIEDYSHIPVLAEQTVSVLTEGFSGTGTMIDCTLGCGGHSFMILERLPQFCLVGIDRDRDALIRAEKRLSFAANRIKLVRCDFGALKEIAQELNLTGKVDGILMDLGVSSPQIDDPSRGFSFRFNGPLDMRMDRTGDLTAARVLNTYPEKELERIFREYGELRESSVLARAVVKQRELSAFATTDDLSGLCAKVLHRKGRSLPSPTLAFQALRIEVNGELDQLQKALEDSLEVLKPGGRIAVITFHSLEDRIVKHYFSSMAETCKCPPGLPVCVCGWKKKMELLMKKPVTADEKELALNPRSGCAKLRAAVKL